MLLVRPLLHLPFALDHSSTSRPEVEQHEDVYGYTSSIVLLSVTEDSTPVIRLQETVDTLYLLQH